MLVTFRNSLAALVVGVTLAACGGGVSVPDVLGLSYDNARDQLEAQGIRVDREDGVDEDAEIGDVIEQSPAAGEKLEEGERVTLTVAVEPSQTIKGTILLKDTFRGRVGEACSGEGGYSDMRAGATVTITNESGQTIGVGRLENGEGVKGGSLTSTDSSREFLHCQFSFTVNDVTESAVYEVEVSTRGGLSYTHEQMEAQNWLVELSLGG